MFPIKRNVNILCQIPPPPPHIFSIRSKSQYTSFPFLFFTYVNVKMFENVIIIFFCKFVGTNKCVKKGACMEIDMSICM